MRFRTRRGAGDGLHKPFRGWQRIAVGAVVLFIAFGSVTARLIVWPAQGMPAHVSAIVVLAGRGDRLAVALQLAREHRAPVLVVSQGWEGYGGDCPPMMSGIKIICFDPNPGNTRGEAEVVGRLAMRYGWSSVVLVTSPGQDTRARIIMGRCFGGSVYVITASLSWSQWPYEIVYGWGALIKALTLNRACLLRCRRRTWHELITRKGRSSQAYHGPGSSLRYECASLRKRRRHQCSANTMEACSDRFWLRAK
jgi:uncharacterized SAM-binding protein YcdF (DUF218 family)